VGWLYSPSTRWGWKRGGRLLELASTQPLLAAARVLRPRLPDPNHTPTVHPTQRETGHVYGKNNPGAVGCAALASESEANFQSSDKRCPQDFALWKAAKPGEPFWESPWGRGRPGEGCCGWGRPG
jgi:hypothetical protein